MLTVLMIFAVFRSLSGNSWNSAYKSAYILIIT